MVLKHQVVSFYSPNPLRIIQYWSTLYRGLINILNGNPYKAALHVALMPITWTPPFIIT